MVRLLRMLSISHSLTGAFLAFSLQHPVLFIPAIFASHYLEDWFPHWDVGTGLTSGKRKREDAIAMEIVELGLTAIFIYSVFQYGHTDIQWLAWIGGGIALIPDFMEAPRNFLKYEPSWLKPFNDLHGFFHHSTPHILVGLAPQIVLWGVIWWMMR
jgi:hypothetical protein